jgi:hypothetical protein
MRVKLMSTDRRSVERFYLLHGARRVAACANGGVAPIIAWPV